MTVSPFSQFGSALPTIPSDPHLVREVQIDWSHDLRDRDQPPLLDPAHIDRQVEDSWLVHDTLTAMTLVQPSLPAPGKELRTQRFATAADRARAKNNQPELPPEHIEKLADGQPVCARGYSLTEAQRTVQHGIKAHNALIAQQRQMPADD